VISAGFLELCFEGDKHHQSSVILVGGSTCARFQNYLFVRGWVCVMYCTVQCIGYSKQYSDPPARGRVQKRNDFVTRWIDVALWLAWTVYCSVYSTISEKYGTKSANTHRGTSRVSSFAQLSALGTTSQVLDCGIVL